MGDLDAVLAALTRDAGPRLAAYGLLLTGSRRAGDDLVRDAIVKVFVRHRRLAGAPAAEGLVRAAMRAIYLAEVRRVTWRRVSLPWPRARATADAGQPYDPDPTGRAMASLPPQERAAVVLRHHDHVSISEIAAAMRTSESTVDQLLSQALATLSRTLGEIAPEFDQVLVVDRSRR